MTMTYDDAREFIHTHADDDNLDQADVNEAFIVIFGRSPDDEDRENGMWSMMVSACNKDDSCCEECGHPIDGSTGGAADCNACDARSR
jgi:hypothetical protein